MWSRWQTIGLAALAVVALACEGAGRANPPDHADPPGRPRPTASPRLDLPSSMVALGDSITAGYGSCLTFVACTVNSWATGSGARVDSHYRRIRADNPRIAGHAVNLARRGARAVDLRGQAAAAVKAKPRYVTILIGANDACTDRVEAMTDPETFRGQIDDALRVLGKGLPEAQILVVSIPDLYRLWQLGRDNPRAARVWEHGFCRSLLANSMSTASADESRRRQVRDRVDDYDRELAAACRAFDGHCRYDGGAAHRVRFTLDEVNRLDYFHPNVAGQARLAEATFPRRFTW